MPTGWEYLGQKNYLGHGKDLGIPILVSLFYGKDLGIPLLSMLIPVRAESLKNPWIFIPWSSMELGQHSRDAGKGQSHGSDNGRRHLNPPRATSRVFSMGFFFPVFQFPAFPPSSIPLPAATGMNSRDKFPLVCCSRDRDRPGASGRLIFDLWPTPGIYSRPSPEAKAALESF